jgi:hypothetical protein
MPEAVRARGTLWGTTVMPRKLSDSMVQASALTFALGRARLAAIVAAVWIPAGLLALSACSGGGSNSPATVTPPAPPGDNTSVNVLTWHYDNSRSGVNPNETGLTPSNVTSSGFGKVAEFTVNGQVDGQILYVSQVNIPNVGKKNVIYFATENDVVYAIDADSMSGSDATVLWSTSLVPAGEAPASTQSGCGNINPNGVTATPVIDVTRNAIYLVAMTMNAQSVTTQFDRLHALDLGSGAELFGGPTTIAPTYPGTQGNVLNNTIVFDPVVQHDRAALTEVGNQIYTAWSGMYGDCSPYSAWIVSFNAATLAQSGAIVLAPDYEGAGIWLGGAGLSADAAGSLYVPTGNATSNLMETPAIGDYPESVVRLAPGLPLTVADFFMPSNVVSLSEGDEDLSSAGVLLLPDQTDASNATHHLAVASGKDGNLFVLNRDSLGGFHAQNQVVQQFQNGGANSSGNFSTPLFFNSSVYLNPSQMPIVRFPVANALLATTPAAQSSQSLFSVPTISANGTSNGIVWTLASSVLYAFDATSLNTLYASNQAANQRDSFTAPGSSFITPMVANQRVYIGTQSTVAVFGLLNP